MEEVGRDVIARRWEGANFGELMDVRKLRRFLSWSREESFFRIKLIICWSLLTKKISKVFPQFSHPFLSIFHSLVTFNPTKTSFFQLMIHNSSQNHAIILPFSFLISILLFSFVYFYVFLTITGTRSLDV
jgi:hypothetical protein